MAKFFTFKEIEQAVLLAGFVQDKNNGGSHQVYRHAQSGLMVTIPKHPQGVSVGVGESVLRQVVLAARVCHKNIGAKSNKLNTKVADFILFHHQKCKDNPIFLIPEEIRDNFNISTAEDVKIYLQKQEVLFRASQKEQNALCS